MSTRLTTFRPEQRITEVVQTLIDKNISGGPVLDESGRLVGMISEGDCLREIVKGKYTNTPSFPGTVAEHMAREVITIGAETSILDAAKQFLDSRVRRFPVLKDGALVGQISQRDVMRAVDALKNATW